MILNEVKVLVHMCTFHFNESAFTCLLLSASFVELFICQSCLSRIKAYILKLSLFVFNCVRY